MKKLGLMLIIAFLTFPSSLNFAVISDDCVILLHGLARSDSSMKKMQKALEKSGFYVVNQAYASTKNDIATLSEKVIPNALEKCASDQSISFVSHSMGGIILRQYLSDNDILNLKHVVMLGPPNKGSEVVDKMRNVPGFKALNGPAGLQLGTGDTSIPNSLGSVNYSLGIIAGSKSVNPILSTMLPDPDDGKVSVERTKVDGMTDHIVMPVTHTFMMKNKQVIEQVIYFLESGHFFYESRAR